MSPTVLGKVVHDRPLSVGLRVIILHHAPPSTVQMHAQRCREGEWTVRRVTHRTHTRMKKDAWDRQRQINLKHQYGTVDGECGAQENEREGDTIRIKRMNGEIERAAVEERGLAGLPVPPVSWDYLLLQSIVAQQKQREQQNYTHLPSQPLPYYLM